MITEKEGQRIVEQFMNKFPGGEHRAALLNEYFGDVPIQSIVDVFLLWHIQKKGELFLRVDRDGEFLEMRPFRDGFPENSDQFRYDLVLRVDGAKQ